MKEVVTLREGVARPLLDLFPRFQAPEATEILRKHVTQMSRRLQRDLALRESPFSIVDTVEEAQIISRGVAGTVRIAGVEFDVAPKHVIDPNDNWRAALVFMLERASGRRSAFTQTSRLQLKQRTFIDQFAYGFALELRGATQHSPIMTYKTSRMDLPHLRGRMLVSQQLRNMLTNPHRIICEVDSLDTDNPTNRLLHWATRRLLSMTSDPRVRKFLSAQADRLPPVSEPVYPPTRLLAAVPRQFSHYNSVVEMALALARGKTTFPGISDAGGAGFVVGTERLFEAFIEKSLASTFAGEHAGWHVRPQAREIFAVPEDSGTKYYSQPDNVLDHLGSAQLVVDAKYKRFADATDESHGSRPTNSDLYQMVAACVAHKTPRALLLYPKLQDGSGADSWSARWWSVEIPGSTPVRVGAATVDLAILGGDGGLRSFDSAFRSMLLGLSGIEAKSANEIAI